MRHEQQQDLESTSIQEPAISADTGQNSQKVEEKVSFVQKTERIKAWSEFIKSVAPFIWAVVIIIVIIPLLGKALIADSSPGKPGDSAKNTRAKTGGVVAGKIGAQLLDPIVGIGIIIGMFGIIIIQLRSKNQL